MPKYQLSFMEVHNPLFMQGSNLGTKIIPAQKNAELAYDDDRSVVWVSFKGKITAIPLSNVASVDFATTPDDILDFFSGTASTVDTAHLPAAIARKKREQEIVQTAETFDSADESPEAHRARVRAASANANRVQPIQATSSSLIQESRATALGMKVSKAQVSDPTRPKTGTTGRVKPISHAQLNAQMAKEAKEVDPNA